MGDDELQEVGCSARIEEVLERMEDGRMNIVVRGAEPFRLTRRIDDMEYPAGDVELLDDDGDAGPDGGVAAREGYATLVERVTDQRPETADIEGLGSYDMAATVAFDLDEKQELLELRSEADRLKRLTSLFASALDRYEHAEHAAERAKTNGKVHT
jgi:ATP-dependent Lon protease